MTRHAQPVAYPARPASEIDPTGEFERAYAEAAGVQIERMEMDPRDVLTVWFRKELQPYASPYLRKDWVEDLLSTLTTSGLTIVPAAEKAALQARLAEALATRVGDWADQRTNDHLTIRMYEWKDRAEQAEAALAAVTAERGALRKQFQYFQELASQHHTELDAECQQSMQTIARERERAERAEAERDRLLRHVEILQGKVDPATSCACGYDDPDDLCMEHARAALTKEDGK
jgi:hypothetical protein